MCQSFVYTCDWILVVVVVVMFFSYEIQCCMLNYWMIVIYSGVYLTNHEFPFKLWHDHFWWYYKHLESSLVWVTWIRLLNLVSGPIICNSISTPSTYDTKHHTMWQSWSCETNSNHVRDDPKLLDDSGKVSKSNGVVGGSIPSYEIVSLLDKILAR